MLGFFKKKSKKDKLYDKYEKLLAESHRLSTIDRAASDAKRAEAEEIIQQIEALS